MMEEDKCVHGLQILNQFLKDFFYIMLLAELSHSKTHFHFNMIKM